MKRAILALLLFAIPAFAQREAPPATGTPKNVTVPEVRRFELPNGVDVRFVQWGTMPKAIVRIVTRTGAVDEGPNEVNLAGLVVNLMQQGTATRTPEQVAKEIALMGGALEARADIDEVTIGADVFGNSAPAAVTLLADIVRNPRMPEAELARLKADLARGAAINRSVPQEIAMAKFVGTLFGDHAYGRWFPTDAMISAYTIDQARAFYDRNFGGQRTAVYVVGRFDEAAVERAVRTAFDGWRSGTAPAPVSVNASRRRGIYLIDRPGAVQSTLIIGLPAPRPSNPDFVALALTDTILGGAFTSRITQNIRERRGYTYSPRSTVTNRAGATTWDETADVTTNVTGAALREILGEIERLGRETPPLDEVRRMQNLAYGSFVRRLGSRPGIASQLAFLDLHGLGDDYLRTYVQRLFAVTPEEVQRVARESVNPGELTIVVVGDKSQVTEQLKEFGPILE